MQIPAYVGTIIDVIVVLILIFSFIGGLKSGAIKEFFGLLSFIIAIPLSCLLAPYLASCFSFIGDSTWRYFLAFMLTMFILVIILQLIFLIPRHLLEKVWSGGFFFIFLGGFLGILNSALGLVFLVCLLDIYPVLPWLDSALALSGVMNWLVGCLGGLLRAMLNSTNLDAGLAASISFFSV